MANWGRSFLRGGQPPFWTCQIFQVQKSLRFFLDLQIQNSLCWISIRHKILLRPIFKFPAILSARNFCQNKKIAFWGILNLSPPFIFSKIWKKLFSFLFLFRPCTDVLKSDTMLYQCFVVLEKFFKQVNTMLPKCYFLATTTFLFSI